jgi:predicted O-methyltransferase YrrM
MTRIDRFRPSLRAQAVSQVRRRLEHAFYRSPRVRQALTMAYHRRIRERRYDLSHLSVFAEQEAAGPVQRDEALFLYALTRLIRPRTIVEIGFLFGRSAFNFLQAMDPGAHLYSFDVSDEAAAVAAEHFENLPHFTFHKLSQTEIEPDHVGGGPVDLAFLDAAHELALNQEAFLRLSRLLSANGIIAVHDTGTWRRDVMLDVHRAHAQVHGAGGWLSEGEYQHQADERRFVNWVLERGDFDVVHLHTTVVLRHGLTLLQRRMPLPTGDHG